MICTAQRIREIVLSRFPVYIRVCGEKNDETCRTHAKKYLHSICLQIHAGDAPYSPFLNIVEQAISSLKAAIKGDVSRPKIQARMDDREEARCLGIPLGEMRTRLLLDALQHCIGVITAAKAYQWFRFMQTYLPRCLNGEEIEG